ncbi:MAG: T9SS type A sorting domain-containing protein [Saprospiraceae bacterium]
MCTLNSLHKTNRFVISLGAILSLILFSKPEIILAENSSFAHLTKIFSASATTTITAPNDRIVQIKSSSNCDTIVNLMPAIINLMPGCSLRSVSTSSSFQTLNGNGGMMHFYTGIYIIKYCVEDNCGTIVCDSMKLIVLDSELPNMVCTPEFIVNLNSNGEGSIPASFLDGGSSDNCGHLYFKAKRMNPPIGYSCTSLSNPNYNFDDNVIFCCKDIFNSPIRVIVRVYDVFPGDGVVADSFYNNHYRECMVMITVGDKLAPSLWIPDNITVNCGTDIDSLLASSSPTYSDNCFSVSLTTKIIKKINSCGYGTIERIFTVKDSLGLVSSKTQIITVLPNSVFNGLDESQLKWPEHKTIYICRVNLDLIDAGKPIINEAECDNIIVSKKDNLFYFDRGGVCGKILRNWQVINWCVYNPLLIPNPNIPENGYYSFVQEIKIMDTIPPLIINARDTLLFSLASDCGFSFFILSPISASDCGQVNNLTYRFSIDLNNDGTIDINGNGQSAQGLIPVGHHIVHYYVEDSCHNQSHKSINLIIKDGKAPSLSLLYGLGTTLQEMNGGIMASICARSFNHKSEDNCTPAELLRYSFSRDINDSCKIFTCDDIGVKELEVYIWDECNNFSFTKTFLNIQDINNLCPTGLVTHNIVGSVKSENGVKIENAVVLMKDSLHYEIKNTNINGEYAFENIPSGMKMLFSTSSNEEPLNGVTTADIVKIQQHILGKNEIHNPYELLAADVDQNGRISSSDISTLRKLILGVINEFPSKQSYLFMDDTYHFKDKSNPWQEFYKNSTILLEKISGPRNVDFIGIKLGDVNSSLKQRDSKLINLSYTIENNEIIFYSQSNIDLLGIQLSIDLGSDFMSSDYLSIDTKASPFSNVEYHQEGNVIKLMAIEDKPITLTEENELFRITIPWSPSMSFDHVKVNLLTTSEIVDSEMKSNPLKLIERNSAVKDGFKIVGYGPNPIEDYFDIVVSTVNSMDIAIGIIEQSGKIISQKDYKIKNKIETLRIRVSEFPHAGIYLVQLRSNSKFWSQKILIK